MNLCLACRDIGPQVHGGLARATRDLAVGLAAEGHSVHLLTDSSPQAQTELPGVSIHQLPVSWLPGRFGHGEMESASHNLMHAAALHREVSRIHQDRKVDAVLAPLWRSEGVVCLLDERFPTIVSCMTSLQTLTEVDGSLHLWPDISERLGLERETLRRSRYLHGLTEAVLRKTIDDYDLTPDMTAVINRGLRDRSTVGANDTSSNGAVRVLTVGRLERRKGIDTLVAAAGELANDGVAVHFTLAGPDADPSYRASLQRQMAETHGLNRILRFAGPVTDSDLHRLYRASDVVCVPSRYESHGIVLVEAMMFGKPVVTCDAGGIGEVVEAGRNALVCPPEDPVALATALRRLIEDAELRAKLGREGRRTYEAHFDLRSILGPMQSFVEKVIAAHRLIRGTAGDVSRRLEVLLQDAFDLPAAEATGLVRDLLDPGEAARRRLVEDEAALERARSELLQSKAEIAQLSQALAAQEETLRFLHGRHVTLTRVEQGGWWTLRSYLRPLLRIASRLRSTRPRSMRRGRVRQ